MRLGFVLSLVNLWNRESEMKEIIIEKCRQVMKLREEFLFDEGAYQLGGKMSVSDSKKMITHLLKAVNDACELRREIRKTE